MEGDDMASIPTWSPLLTPCGERKGKKEYTMQKTGELSLEENIHQGAEAEAL